MGQTQFEKAKSRPGASKRVGEAATAHSRARTPSSTLTSFWRKDRKLAWFVFSSTFGGLSTPYTHHKIYSTTYPLAFPNNTCPLCKQSSATQAHIFATCTALTNVRRRAAKHLTSKLSSLYKDFGFTEDRACAWIRKSCILKEGTWLPNSPQRLAPNYSLGLIPPQALALLSQFKYMGRSLADDDRHIQIQHLVWRLIEPMVNIPRTSATTKRISPFVWPGPMTHSHPPKQDSICASLSPPTPESGSVPRPLIPNHHILILM